MNLKELNRRDFLQILGFTALGAAAACAPEAPATPSPTPTESPTLTPAPTRTATPDIRPNSVPQTSEKHDSIPGLSIETWKNVPFVDVTPFFSSEEQQNLFIALQKRTNAGSVDRSYLYDPSPRFFCDMIKLSKGDRYPTESVYYNPLYGKVYAGFGQLGRDEDIVGWPRVFTTVPTGSLNGKVIYGVTCLQDTQVFTECDPAHQAIIVADIPQQTKTIIREVDGTYTTYSLSADGNTLLIDRHGEDGAYIVNVSDWSIKKHISNKLSFNGKSAINEDGSKISILEKEWITILDVATQQTERFYWPTNLSHLTEKASPNFDYFATTVALFPSNTTEPGQWGVLVKTPHGFEWITSPKRVASFSVARILNDGTVVTGSYFIKPDKDGKYTEAIRMSDDKHIPLSDF
jgi:hypothetical protein